MVLNSNFMKTTISQRLANYLDHMRISQEDYREVIGVKKQQVSAWLTFKEDVPDKHLIKTIEMYQNLNARWLLTGEGPMLEAEKVNELEKLSTYKQPDIDNKSNAERELELTKKLLERTEELLREREKRP